MLNPCPNPTTLPPLPSASFFFLIARPEIFHPPLPLLQRGPGARVTNARPGLALFCPFSFFHCFSQCPASSAVHVRFPRARGPLYTTRWGRSLGLGESLGSVWDTRAAARRGWRLNSQGGRNREGGGKWDWWEERVSSHKIQTHPTAGKSTTDYSTFQTRVLLLLLFSIHSISCMVRDRKESATASGMMKTNCDCCM